MHVLLDCFACCNPCNKARTKHKRRSQSQKPKQPQATTGSFHSLIRSFHLAEECIRRGAIRNGSSPANTYLRVARGSSPHVVQDDAAASLAAGVGEVVGVQGGPLHESPREPSLLRRLQHPLAALGVGGCLCSCWKLEAFMMRRLASMMGYKLMLHSDWYRECCFFGATILDTPIYKRKSPEPYYLCLLPRARSTVQ